MYRRLFSLGGGLVLGTLIVFMAVGVLPCPKLAQADHVSPIDSSCKEYAVAHPDTVPQPGSSFYEACQFTEAKQADLDRLLDSMNDCPPGYQCGFVAPGPSAAKKAFGNIARNVSPEMAAKAAQQGLATGRTAMNVLLKYFRPDGTQGAFRTQLEMDVASGAGAMRANGTTYPECAGQSGVITGTSSMRVPDSSYIEIRLRVHGKGTCRWGASGVMASDGTQVASLPNLSSATTNPVVHKFLAKTGVTYRFFAQDAKYQGTTTDRREFGASFSLTQPATAPEVFDIASATPAQPAEVTPNTGDHVMSPTETRTIYDGLVKDPSYQPFVPPEVVPDPPPGVERDQWDQHQKRRQELTPPHGTPVGEPTVNQDGSVTTRFSDGTTVTTWPDLTEVVINRNGDQVWNYPSGPTREYSPETGEERITYPDQTILINRPGQAPQWLRPPSPGVSPEPIPTPPVEQYPPPPSGNYSPPPAQEGTAGCPSARKFSFDLPDMNLADVFPFSLILRAVQWFDLLASPPVAPSFNLPFFGRVSVPRAWDGMMGGIRAAVLFICGIGMSFWFYRYVSGRGSE